MLSESSQAHTRQEPCDLTHMRDLRVDVMEVNKDN